MSQEYTPEQIRTAFEDQMRSVWWGDSFHAERHPKAPDEYLKAPEQMAWIGWQAAYAYAATLRQQAARVDEDMVERAASAFMRVRGLGMARPWEGMLESSRESYRPAFRAALEAALSAQPAERQGEAKPKFFGMACTVAWTELHNAMAADGMSPPAKCGKATRDWIEGIVRDTFTHPAAPVGVPDARIIDLAERLVASGPKAAHVSASECHEISDFILSLAAAPSAPQGEG